MTKLVEIIVRISDVDKRGKVKRTWERQISEENGFPPKLAQDELFSVAHIHLVPPTKPSGLERD